MTIKLYDYWRSSAAYRVRIALNVKGIAYESVETSLQKGDHQSPEYRAKNPQGLVPMIEAGSTRISQSLAIIDWLDATYPDPPLLPKGAEARAAALAMALIVGADIHPINNLRVLKYLKNEMGHPQDEIDQWIRHWIAEGFAALEAQARDDAPFLSGTTPGLADIFLVPQMYNARRFDTPLDVFPRLVAIDGRCTALPAFAAAHPEAVQPKA